MASSSKPPSPSAAALESRPRRRRFSAAEKLSILEEVAAAPRGTQGAVLRKHGIYSSHVQSWRKSLETHGREGIVQKPGPKSDRAPEDVARIRELEKQLARTQKELHIVQELNSLQKKVSVLFGITLPTLEEPDEQ